MKQHVKTVILCLLLLALLPIGVLAAEMALPEYYQESYYAELGAMYQRLKDAEGPRIVIVGGSNVAFGVDTGRMEQLLAEKGYDYTVCSFGLYAAVGTSAMLDLSQKELREGDIVILALEPNSETMSTYFGATAFWKCAEGAPQLLTGVSREKREALAGNYIPYLQERYGIYTSQILPKVEGVYAKASFNDRCDMIYPREGNIMALGFDPAEQVDLTAVNIAPAFAEQVNTYCSQAGSVGAQVFLSFCPVNRTALVGDAEESVQAFFTMCNETFACPIISDPNAYILDSGWFYDSNFHLNSAGAELRSCLLTEDILTRLGCYEKPDFELPLMPGSAAQAPDSTGNAEHFTFKAIRNGEGKSLGYWISGLSDSGKEQTELSAPSVYNDLPVVGFTADGLKDGIKLERLRLPESIESLPEGIFRSCRSLTQLILEHKKQPCSITEHAFDGADGLKILVPSEAYPMYRDGYGCETNPWTPYLDRIYTF